MGARTFKRVVSAALLAVALPLLISACGGGGDETTDEVDLDQATLTSNLEDAGYTVVPAEVGQSALPSLVDDVSFATGTESGFESAVQVSGNGLEPFDPADVTKTGFVLLYDSADSATAADDSIGAGEGQQREGNALFMYGNGLDPPPPEFGEMVAAATGE